MENMKSDWENETELLRRIYDIIHRNGQFSAYLAALKSDSVLTSFISNVLDELSREMGTLHYKEYYTIDHVLYRKEDRIAEGILPYGTSRVHGTWLKHFRVAFEHENKLDAAGGYQEIAKLILVNADVKVLMGYADKGRNYDPYARDYQKIYDTSGQAASARPILFIGEYLDGHSEAYLITVGGLLKYRWDLSEWQNMES